MDIAEKREFIEEITARVRDAALVATKNMPKEWTGLELRQYLADKFCDATFRMGPGSKRAYNNEVLVRNL